VTVSEIDADHQGIEVQINPRVVRTRHSIDATTSGTSIQTQLKWYATMSMTGEMCQTGRTDPDREVLRTFPTNWLCSRELLLSERVRPWAKAFL